MNEDKIRAGRPIEIALLKNGR